MSSTLHAFVAVPVDRAVVQEGARQQEVLKRLGGDCLPRRRIYLTLDDLGVVPEPSLEAVEVACRRVAEQLSPFTLRVGGLCGFPDPARPRVVGLNVHDTDGRLGGVRARLHAALTDYGFALDQRRFWPHVALARMPGTAPLDPDAFVFNQVSLRVQAIQLVVQTAPEMPGPTWQVRRTFELGAEASVAAVTPTDPEAALAEIAALLDARVIARAEQAAAKPRTRRRSVEQPAAQPEGPRRRTRRRRRRA